MATIELINKRVGNDIKIALMLTDGGMAVDWATVDKVRAFLVSDQQRVKMGDCRIKGPDAEDPTKLLMLYPASQPEYLGVARLVVTVTYHGHVSTLDKPLLVFVPSTAEEGTGMVEVEAPVTLDPEDNNLEISVTDVDTSVLEEAISDAQEAAAAANEAAEKATQAAGRNPYIGDNDHWYVWDGQAGEFVDTGVDATGEKGDTGEIGPTGPTGPTGPAAGFGTVSATVDANVGTPSVEVSSSGPDTAKVLSFAFHNLKGVKGDPGAAAGFGQASASVDANTGTPSVEVTVTGPDTAKVFTFTFHNLKGEKGDTVSAQWGTITGDILDQTDLQNALDAKQDTISDLSTIRSGAAAGATAYQKPASGIPKTDLASAVQTSLSKADSALQSYTETDPTVPSWAKQSSKPTYTYSEIQNTPTIPDDLEDLNDDATHRLVTDTEKNTWSGKQDTISDLSTIRSGAAAGATAYQKPADGIPASDIASGVIPDVSSFITNTVDNLANYYLKSETYTRAEIAALIAQIQMFVPVQTLPTASADTLGKIYLVPATNPQTQNQMDEYYTQDNGAEASPRYTWELFGGAAIDLSGYVTTQALNAALASYVTSASLAAVATSGSYADLSNKPTIPTVPTISTDIATDSASDTKTASPKAVADVTGLLTNLNTTAKTNLVAAINEVLASVADNPLVDISAPTPYDGTIIFEYANGDTATVDLNHQHPQYYSKAAESTQPVGGFLPDIVYVLGELSGSVTFALASAVSGNVNHYFWTFETGASALYVTWPVGITWQDGSAPTPGASKHCEVSIIGGIGVYMEV